MMPIPRIKLLILVSLTVFIGLCELGLAESTKSTKTEGYRCLFMGHSFFAPIAEAFEEHPARCGFSKHRQTIVYHGGRHGAPGALWNDESEEVSEAKAMLKSGAVDLLGLTFYPEASQLEDYRQWIDLALKHNPDTIFVIHSPWPRYLNRTLAQYQLIDGLKDAYITGLIKKLCELYPNTNFLCIPQGKWMIGLWQAMERGDLPEVSAIKRTSYAGQDDCLFVDNLGHGGKIPIQLGTLLWLATIYEVDLEQYDWDMNVELNVKKLAKEICQD